jgi:NADPH-dependent glutamate synthase beta subunit-like oxidoreductase
MLRMQRSKQESEVFFIKFTSFIKQFDENISIKFNNISQLTSKEVITFCKYIDIFCRDYFEISSVDYQNLNLTKPHKIKRKKIDFNCLINLNQRENKIYRNNFNYYKNEFNDYQQELNDCLVCHDRKKDSCRDGLKKDETLVKDDLGNVLNGCPLRQRISEMICLKQDNYHIGALMCAIIDNPLLPLTGEKICNDCQKSCILHNHSGIDIPLIESRILQNIIDLQNGREVYLMLAKFSKFIFTEKYLSFKGKNAFLAGAGPANLSLAYYLLQNDVNVVMVDNLNEGFNEDKDSLEGRNCSGIGGVLEYGVTARWNKKNIDLAKELLLDLGLRFIGGVKFGSQITSKNIIDYGFDLISIGLGCGMPKIPNNIDKNIDGIMTANDLLYSLHINGKHRINNDLLLKIKPPVCVLGLGLTAVDVATEAQVIMNKLYPGEKVSLIYSNELNKSKAYRINHYELQSAVDQGVMIIENQQLGFINKDENGRVSELKMRSGDEIDCATLILAIGTNQNISIAKNEDNFILLKNEMYKIDDDLFTNNCIKNCSIIVVGDANYNYSGSVVKALASGRDCLEVVNKALQKRTKNLIDIDDFCNKFTSIIEEKITYQDRFILLKIKSEFIVKNSKIGNLVKISIDRDDLSYHSIPATIIDKSTNSFSVIIECIGDNTSKLKKLEINDSISVSGPSGRDMDFTNFSNKLLIISEGRGVIPSLFFAKHLNFLNKSSDIIAIHSCVNNSLINEICKGDCSSISLFDYQEFVLNDISNYQVEEIILIITKKYFNEILQKVKESFPQKKIHLLSIDVEMNCMLEGFCGRCCFNDGLINQIYGIDKFHCFNSDVTLEI